MKKLIGKLKITTELTLLSGLHIGESRERADIGGIDNPVIRRKDRKQQPYLPGSSLKGKIRSLLEQIGGIDEVGGGRIINRQNKSTICQQINLAFGYAHDDLSSRLIFRDSYLESNSAFELENSEFTDMPYTEAKTENTINRITGKAGDPRTQERVPAGSKFIVEIIIDNYDDGKTENIKNLLVQGIEALNNDYLGGNGSRGSGHVKIDIPNELNTAWKEETITFENVFSA